MAKYTKAQALAAHEAAVVAYAAAVKEFRRARAELGAWDILHNRPGFGIWPGVVELRHQFANPDESGYPPDDIREALASIRIVD
ncbi:hypothetical protein [Bradyrhizobium sp. LeoA1S1]